MPKEERITRYHVLVDALVFDKNELESVKPEGLDVLLAAIKEKRMDKVAAFCAALTATGYSGLISKIFVRLQDDAPPVGIAGFAASCDNIEAVEFFYAKKDELKLKTTDFFEVVYSAKSKELETPIRTFLKENPELVQSYNLTMYPYDRYNDPDAGPDSIPSGPPGW